MGMLSHLLGLDHANDPGLLPAIERAVTAVEPLLKQTRRYPDAYRKSVKSALEYARNLAHSVPGPVTADLNSYARDAYVHAIFPSMELVAEAFRSSRAMQEYLREHPSIGEIYALMGMRRREKNMMGMELSGQVIQRDVPQQVVYFTSHTIENPAPTEKQARELVAWAFFDNLVRKVAKRVELRKQEMHAQQEEKDMLMARLHAASPEERPALEAELSRLLSGMQTASKAMDLHYFPEDFEAVLLAPEQHLRLNQFPMLLDSMGIKLEDDGTTPVEPVVFNDLIGFDRRDWTVTMVHCPEIQSESFAERLEMAYRRLSI